MILSNGSTSVAERLLERAGIAEEFEKLMTVADGPAWKPAAAYRRALEVCGVPGDEAMVVAVHQWDIDGAARAGLRTGWLRRGAAGYLSYFRVPEVEVADLEELAVALARRDPPRADSVGALHLARASLSGMSARPM